MAGAQSLRRDQASENREFLMGLGRAAAGALIFALPMLMTMEMWWLGFYIEPFRLALLLVLAVPLLLGLSHYAGFRPSIRLRDHAADVFVVLVVAAMVAVITLYIFGLLRFGMSAREIVGKVTVQTVPGSIGAMLARSQLGQASEAEERRIRHPSYGGELFLMGAGALFLSFNVAPTEEMILIAYQMTVWQELTLAVLSLLLMHAFVYAVSFRGGSARKESVSFLSVFLRFSIVGYAIVLLVSLFVLWTFGRTEGAAAEHIISTSVVLGFPGAVGAAAARLIL